MEDDDDERSTSVTPRDGECTATLDPLGENAWVVVDPSRSVIPFGEEGEEEEEEEGLMVWSCVDVLVRKRIRHGGGGCCDWFLVDVLMVVVFVGIGVGEVCWDVCVG